MLTKRDIEIFKFINRYGKSYNEVMARTFFSSPITSSKRLNELQKQGLITFWNTKHISPRRAIVLTNEAKEYLSEHHDLKPKNAKMNLTTLHHNIVEQIADFHLSQIGQVIRTTISEHSKTLHHVPDFIFISKNNQRFNIEIEFTKKSQSRYKEILIATSKDAIDGILYIFPKREDIERYIDFLPKDRRLLFIDIDSLISNITNFGKINPISQEQNLFQNHE